MNILEDLTSKLNEMSQTFEMALDAGQIGCWSWNINTDELYWDKRMFTLFGANENLFNKSGDFWIKRIAKEDRQKFKDDIRWFSLKAPALYNGYYKIITDEGEEKFIKMKGNVIKKDSEIKLIGICLKDDCASCKLRQAYNSGEVVIKKMVGTEGLAPSTCSV